MTEYLPLTTSAQERSRLEAQQRAAGLQAGDVTQTWHNWIVHPITAQAALVISGDADKEFLSVGELSALLSDQEATDADWLIDFEGEI